MRGGGGSRDGFGGPYNKKAPIPKPNPPQRKQTRQWSGNEIKPGCCNVKARLAKRDCGRTRQELPLVVGLILLHQAGHKQFSEKSGEPVSARLESIEHRVLAK